MNSKEFLETLYGGLENKYLYLWTLPAKATHWYKSEEIDQMALDAHKFDNEGCTVYFGVGAGDAAKREHSRLSASEVTVIPGIWLDIDINGAGHAGGNYPPNTDEAMRIINSLPIEPSLIVDSGGGLHVYYLFKEAWELDTLEEKIKASWLLVGIRSMLKRNTKYQIDDVQDLARILRPVGMVNRKYNKKVKILKESDIRYSFDDIDQYIPEPIGDYVNKSFKRDGRYPPFERRDTDQPAQNLLEKCEFIRHCRDHASTLSYSEWMAMIGNVGRCSDGIAMVHELSKSYFKYSVTETDAKIYENLNHMSPASCDNIQDIFKCKNLCANIKNPFSYATGGKMKQPEHDRSNGNKHIVKSPVTMSASDLMKMDLPETTWTVPRVICEGVTLLAGSPKIGKSWLCLGLGISVANGGMALGQIETVKRDVLYISLEDNNRRLQKRLETVTKDNETVPEGLILCTEWQKSDDGGVEQLEEWIIKNPNCKLIIIDTWSKFRGKINSRIGAYMDDYNAISPIKKIADRNHISIILVHHTRKMSGQDVFDEVSGSTGLTGAVDATIILKRVRGQTDAVLHITGRDVEECEQALSFDKDFCQWNIVGDADKYKTSALGVEIQELLKKSAKEMTPKEISQILNASEQYVKNTLKTLLGKELINKCARGKYRCL